MGGVRTRTVSETAVQAPTVENRLTEDDLFKLLSNERRRHILCALIQEEGPLDIGSLSQEIAAREDGTAYEQVTSKDRKRVYTALQQSHLPKMDRTGVLEFDQDRGTIESTAALEDVEIYLNVVRGHGVPWSDYYLGLTVLSAVVLGASLLAVFPFTAIHPHAVTLLVVASFGVTALVHGYYTHQNRLRIGVGSVADQADASDDVAEVAERSVLSSAD